MARSPTWTPVYANVCDEDDQEFEVKTQCQSGSPSYRTMNCPMGYPADPPEMDTIYISADDGKTWESLDDDHALYKDAEEALWESYGDYEENGNEY